MPRHGLRERMELVYQEFRGERGGDEVPLSVLSITSAVTAVYQLQCDGFMLSALLSVCKVSTGFDCRYSF